jgi:hypothetical protein
MSGAGVAGIQALQTDGLRSLQEVSRKQWWGLARGSGVTGGHQKDHTFLKTKGLYHLVSPSYESAKRGGQSLGSRSGK